MKIKSTKFETPLNAAAVDRISEETTAVLTALQTEKKNAISIRLNVEEMALRMMDRFGEDTTISYEAGQRLGRPFITLTVKAPEYDPIDESDEEFGEMSSHIMAGMGLRPSFEYKKGENRITYKLKKKRSNPLKTLAIAVVLALIAGFAGMLLPDAARNGLNDGVLTPLYETFLRMLSAVAGPMIFLSVAWGIYGIGDAETLGRIGKKMLLRFFFMSLLIAAVTALILFPFFRLRFIPGSAGGNEFKSILDLILGIIPSNVFSPFIDGNTLQVILLAVVAGIVMIILGQQTRQVAVLIEQINCIIQYLMELVAGVVSFFVFLIIVRLIWSKSYESIIHTWKPILLPSVLSILIILATVIYVSVRMKVSVPTLIRKLLPTFLVALSTASSSAAFGTNMNTCVKDLGMNKKIAGFGIPIGIVLYKPGMVVSFMGICYFFMEYYNQGISISWLIIAVIVVTIVSIAMPPVPGGGLVCYSIVFSQLGIPLEAVGIVAVVDVISDFVVTAVGMTLLQLELLQSADKMKLVDREILQKEKVGKKAAGR
ncbi:MAG: cation:dicarboxylase symporter family transporter [Parasporobacterium sp.]|nr:cation:dicarboxylase symporter family transporter [Parasporobacterium sp.]